MPCAGRVLALGALLCFLVPDAAFAQQPFIDTHTHPIRNARRSPIVDTPVLRTMADQNVALTILMPPPFAPGMNGTYGRRELAPLAARNPGKIAFIAGGESLNPMLQQTPAATAAAAKAAFTAEAEAIVQAGAAGFGEIALEHFSSGRGQHPYERAPADHPLMLALTDIAARAGMPIDIHMEAVPRDMPFPGRAGPPNPPDLHENLGAFARLLAHNRDARIVWAHAGWDLTGERTVPLMRTLLRDHPNLYMSLKMDRAGSPATQPLAGSSQLRGDWQELLREFPDRFVIGSDQFFDEEPGRLLSARHIVDALPPEIVKQVALDNPRRIYRLR